MTTLRYRQDGYFRANRRDNLGKNYITNNLGRLTGIALPPEVVTLSYSNSNSITFDGVNEWLSGSNTTLYNFERTDTFSFSLWVKLGATAASDQMLMARNNGSNKGWRFAIDASQRVNFLLLGGSGNTLFRMSVATASVGAWTNVIITYAGTSDVTGTKIYFNGTESTYTDISNTLAASTVLTAATRMAVNSDGANFYNGKVDEASVWNKTLSTSDISSIYNAGKPSDLSSHASSANLIGWWKVDGDSIPTINDSSGNGYTFTAVNMEAGDITSDVP